MFQKLLDLFRKFPRRTIVDIIVVLIPIFLIYLYFNTRTPEELKQTLRDNKRIEAKVDTLKLDNQFLLSRMYEYEKKQIALFESLNENNELIKENNNQLTKLKRIYNEKITNANNYNISQLDSFFTERYKQYYR